MKKILKISGMLLAGVLALCLGVYAATQTIVSFDMSSTVNFYIEAGVNVGLEATAETYSSSASNYVEVAGFSVNDVANLTTGQGQSFDNEVILYIDGDGKAIAKYNFEFTNLTDEDAKITVTFTTDLSGTNLTMTCKNTTGVTENAVTETLTTADATFTAMFELELDVTAQGTDNIQGQAISFTIAVEHVAA